MASKEVGAAYVTIMPSLKGFNAQISKQVSSSAGAFSGLKTAAAAAGAAIAGMGIAKAVKDFASFGLATASAAETTEISFTTMLGSAEAAQQMIAQLSDFAAKTPFDLSGLQDATRQLLAYGFQAEEVIPMLTAVGDATSALGTGQEGIDAVTRALGQMQTRGKVSAEEMLQLTEQGIPAWEYLAEAIGTDTAGAMEQVSKGAVKASDGIKALTDGMERDFGGMMEAQSKTLTGVMSNLSDAIQRPLMALKDTSGYQALAGALSGLVDVAGPLVESVLPVLDSGMSAAAAAIQEAAAAAPAITQALSALPGQVSGVFGQIGNLVGNAAQLWDIGDALPQKVRLVFAYAANVAKQGVADLDAAVQSGLSGLGQNVPALSGLAGAVSDVVSAVGGMSGVAGVLLGAAAAFEVFKTAASLAPVASGMASAVGAIAAQVGRFSMLSQLYGDVVARQVTLTRASQAMSTAISAINWPLLAVVAAVAALAAGFVYFYSTSEEFRGAIDGIISTLGSQLAPIFDSVSNTLSNFAATAIPMVTNAIAALAPAFQQIVTAATQIAAAIIPVVAAIAAAVLPVITTIATTILNVATSLITAVAPAVGGIASMIATAVSAVAPVLTGFVTILGQLAQIALTAFSTMAAFIIGAISQVAAVVAAGFTAVVTVVSGAVTAVGTFLGSLVSTVSSAFQNVVNFVTNAGTNAYNAISSAFNNMVSTVSTAVGSLVSTVSSIPGKVQEIFANAGSWLVDSGKAMIDGLVSGVLGAIDGAASTISGALSGIRDLFPFSPAKKGPFSGHGYTTYSGKALITDFGGAIARYGGVAVQAVNGVVGSVRDALSNAAPPDELRAPSVSASGYAAAPRDGYAEVADAVDRLLAALATMGVYLDGTALVGRLLPEIDKGLGRRQAWSTR